MLASVGCQVQLTCLDGGSPPAEFLWRFNGMPLGEGGGVVVGGAGQLLLSNVQLEDTGNYSCTVLGDFGEGSAVTMVTVEDPLFGSGVPSAPPTLFSPSPSVQQLPTGRVAQFVCLVSGFPAPEVVWLRDGQPLPNLRRITALREAMSVRGVRVTDVGVYECVASNPLGQDSLQFLLNVTGVWVCPGVVCVCPHIVWCVGVSMC